METKYKYVWLNMETGKFSNSWVDEDDLETLIDFKDSTWKLIKYSCLNDDDFEFYKMMRLK